MNSLNDSWLDFLVKHSIFELKDSEQKYSENIKAKQTRQENNITDFVLQHHNRVISIRDNDLFVAVGPQIRVLNLTSFKDTWMKLAQEADEKGVELSDGWIQSVHYKILDTPEINFRIESMIPNKNGRLLAVTGEQRLVIVCLPRQGFSTISDTISRKKIDCRTLSVGTKYYDSNKTSILKIEWHPLSETRTHIVVLGNDSILRMFDVSADIDNPEQFFDLSPAEQRKPQQNRVKIGYSIDDEDNFDEDVVSFALGGPSKDSSGWECFTIFYALRSGHIYALCPVIPYRSIVRRSHLDNLLCLSEAKYEQAKSGSANEHKTLSHLYSLHSVWIDILFQSAKITRKTIALDNDNLTVSSDNQHSLYPVRRQGPFLINHTELFNAGIEVTDMLFLNAEPVSCIALAMNTGVIHNYILGSEIDAQWQLPVINAKNNWQKELAILLTDSEFLPKASLYEIINLKAQEDPKFQSVTLITDPLYEDVYYAYHAGGVHAISMTNWIKNLRDISIKYESGQDAEAKRDLDGWLKEKSSSEVRLLVNTSPFKDGFLPIAGLAIITDIYLSYSLLAITSGYRLVIRELNMRRDTVISEASQNAIKAQLKDIGAEEGVISTSYQALLPLPAFVPPPQLDSLPKQAKVVIPSEMSGSKEIVVNEETLRFFAKASEQIRREARDIKKAASKIDSRLLLQQKEFERQLNTVRELYDRLQKVNSDKAKDETQQKLRDIAQKHTKLRLRIDEQLRTLMKNYQPELSKEEEEWIEKLEKLSKKVSGESGYAARIKMLQEQLKQAQDQKTNVSKLNTTNMNPIQLKNILRTLNDQSLTIDEIKDRMKNLQNKVSTTVA